MIFDKIKKDSEGGLPPREMVKGKWNCAECGVEITELPFEPAPDRPVHCKECWAKKREERGPRRDFGPRELVKGNWNCAECGVEITELPFRPTEGQPVHCKECWIKKKAEG